MALELNQLKKSLKSPANKAVIQRAVTFEQRLKFHTETNIAMHDVAQQSTSFLEWVKGLIPQDKFNVFLQLFSLPLPTISVVEDVYRELERVFYSRNSSSSYQFTSSELAEDWNDYKKNKLNEPNIWKNEGFNRMKVGVNSILIVDLPTLQTTTNPEPYFYWLDISHVIDFSTKDGKQLDWIIFKQPNNQIAVFDDITYRVFKVNEKNEIVSVVSSVRHTLGYCPARFFWSSTLSEAQPLLKKNPITKELANLDWLLFFSISKRHLDLYAPYPIYSAYEAECDFTNTETGEYCDGGFIKDSGGSYKITNGGLLDKCPVCSEKRLAGPGSFLEIPTPNVQEGVPDMKSPVQITTIDLDSLQYNVDECDRLRQRIVDACTGYGGTVSEKEAINETQVAANFENKTSVLNALKTNYENAQKFIDDTCCKLRYAEDFISSSISWGSEFYVFTIDNLYNKYKLAKENGASEAELDSIATQILEIEYKNNPIQLQRMQILKQVEPFRHLTHKEVIDLFDKNLIGLDEVKVKINFNSFVDRFERENINIVEFGSNLPFDIKIKTLINTFIDYGKEQSGVNGRVETPASQKGGAGV